MKADLLDGIYRCPQCGFYASTFTHRINGEEPLDELRREDALQSLRVSNFERILDECKDVIAPSATILDVGCGHGWFLSRARARGYRAIGIEPDEGMAQIARGSGHEVRVGFFPDVLNADERYDAITFNDVFEHLEDVRGAASAVAAHLKDPGTLIINLPVSDGLIFRLARVAARFGFHGAFSRMWQRGFPSPHLSYFSASTLPRFMERQNFTLVRSGRLESLRTEGLFQRIRYDRSVGLLKASALYLTACALSLVTRLFPSDTRYFVFRKK